MAATYSNRHRKLEKYSQVVREDGLNTDQNVNIGVSATPSLWVAGNITSGGTVSSVGGVSNPLVVHPSSAAINSTATATAAQTATGYITSTSAAGTSITLPTGTALGQALGAKAGTVFDLIVDNTAGANAVTIVVNTNAILSDAATTTAASFGQLTVASGATGLARFTLMFSSATAYAFTRTA